MVHMTNRMLLHPYFKVRDNINVYKNFVLIRRQIVHYSIRIYCSVLGVADKIGTGIIEDPLAAFEQIMKDNERRKKERRANDASPRRRSRSIERRRSPSDRRSPRHASSDRDRGRSTGWCLFNKWQPNKLYRRSIETKQNLIFSRPPIGYNVSDMKERSPSRGRDRTRGDRTVRSNERRRRRSGSYHSRQSWWVKILAIYMITSSIPNPWKMSNWTPMMNQSNPIKFVC